MWDRVDGALSFPAYLDRAVLLLFALHTGLAFIFYLKRQIFFCQEEVWTIIALYFL